MTKSQMDLSKLHIQLNVLSSTTVVTLYLEFQETRLGVSLFTPIMTAGTFLTMILVKILTFHRA